MRKSKRIYINQQDIDSGCKSDCFKCPVHRSIQRQGLLKGKTFAVLYDGIYVGPNKKTLDNKLIPDIHFTENGTNFISDFDNKKGKVKPTHITLIDVSGKYL
jgi:hypothetical protein